MSNQSRIINMPKLLFARSWLKMYDFANVMRYVLVCYD